MVWPQGKGETLMLSCKQVTRLVSLSYEKRLSWPERVGVRMHLLMCRFCTRFAQQMRFLHTACHSFQQAPREDDTIYLSQAARLRIHHALSRNY